MTITYKWENVKVNVETEINDNHTDSPHTHEEIRDVEYDFWVGITTDDIVEYKKPYYAKKKDKTEREKEDALLVTRAMERLLDYLLEYGAVDLDALESDESFVEFMKDKYESKAFEEWEKTNATY